MLAQAVIDKIKLSFDTLPDQMRSAATVVIDNPKEVALLSMRDLAKRAGVPAATMTRLAQRLGYSGYEELRSIFVNDLRSGPSSFGSRTQGMLSRRQEIGEKGLAVDVAAAIAEAVAELTESGMLERFSAAADMIGDAQRIYCCGARSSFPVAFLLAYLQDYFWDRACLLDGVGGAGSDPLLKAGPEDVMLAVGFEPYARATVDLVRRARNASTRVVAITDSESAGIGFHADVSIVVSNRSPSFFDSMTPAFAAAEILAAMVAGRIGPDVAARVREREALIADAGLWENAASARLRNSEPNLQKPKKERRNE